jgi:hypothetical protein
MSAFFTFALVVLLIALVLIGFAIANIIYFNQFKSGIALTQSQLTGLVVINALAIILLLIIFFYGIFAAIKARRISRSESISTSGVVAPTEFIVGQPTAIAPAVAATPAVQQILRPTPAPMVPVRPAVALPRDTQLVGSAPAGTQIFRVTKTTTVNPGQFVCSVPTAL